ncbi:MAG: ribose 5-phosphate isomerase B [Acidimicrobiaceae bacterium]|nr:ribose 5-phosphate isomerase B [Acidimicrobiaceae bacterium]
MRASLGCDHAGYVLKEFLKDQLVALGHEVIDHGTYSTEPVDYPDFCAAAAASVVSGEADFGIVIGGSGQGEQISANKVNGIRAALCVNEYLAQLARAHNNANVISFGARIIAREYALEILKIFMSTPFEGGRHTARLEKIAEIEKIQLGKV